MTNVTAQQVKEGVAALGVKWINHHDCSICGTMVGYVISSDGGLIAFRSACGCSWSPDRMISWQEPADYINMQNDEWREKLKARFGIVDPEIQMDEIRKYGT